VIKLKEKHSFFNGNKLLIILTIVILVICGVLFTLWTIDQTDKQLRNDLLMLGILSAKAIDTQDFSELSGKESDLKSQYYQKRKQQLTDMRLSDAKFRFFYLAGKKADGSVFIYLDSESPSSADYSPPGQIYSESPEKIKHVLESGNCAVEGPYTDRWGKWISVFVPLRERQSGKVLAVLGIDVDAKNWSNTIIKNASISVGLFFIIITMVFFVILISRSKQQIKSQQDVIAESEKRFKILFKDSPDAYLILIDGVIADCNISTEILLGGDKNIIIGKTPNDLSPQYQPDGINTSETANEMILHALKTGNHTFEWVHSRFDGGNFWVEVSVSSLTLGSKPALFVSWRDVTQRKYAEEEMIQLNEQLRLSNEELSETRDRLVKINSEKDKFFSIIAHDLKSPFGGFLGLTKIMAEDIQDLSVREMQEFAISMQKSATNLYKLLENLLEWARMQRGVTEFNPENCLLTLFVNQILDVQSVVAKAKEIEFVSHIPEDAEVTVDIPMFNTVLRNLISNALKFTPRGGKIEIGTLMQPSEGLKHSEGSDIIYIKDTGIGMSADTISKLFELDSKVSRPGTEDEPSTGLGLLLCKEFVEKHGGKIWVESELGVGSTFWFSL
jgi:PAS domain S-box-containing protein